jgi:2-methylaconitate cis-trans-isomerase PrpF
MPRREYAPPSSLFACIILPLYASGAIRNGAAAMVHGAIANELCGAGGRQSVRIRIGHPQGVLGVSVKAIPQNGAVKIASATISRTARSIMAGVAYVPADCFIAAGEPKS